MTIADDNAAPLGERLIVALDVPSVAEAKKLVADLDGVASFFKVGLQMQLVEGIEAFTRELIRDGKKVFLDYKYFDIGETVKQAVARAAELGARFVTVHGNGEIIRAAAQGKAGSDLKILCVTLLTSLDAHDLGEVFGAASSVEDFVLSRARKSIEFGCDGVIASPREVAALRRLAASERFLIVTPGIRPEGSSTDDHKRPGTPTEAIGAGADYLVVGRPITRDPDPAGAARRILGEMAAAFEART